MGKYTIENHSTTIDAIAGTQTYVITDKDTGKTGEVVVKVSDDKDPVVTVGEKINDGKVNWDYK